MSGRVDSSLDVTISPSLAWGTYWEVKNNKGANVGQRLLMAQKQEGQFRLRPATSSFAGTETSLAKRTASTLDRSKAQEAVELFLGSLSDQQKKAAQEEIAVVKKNGTLTEADVRAIMEKSLPGSTVINCIGQDLLKLDGSFFKKCPQLRTLEVSPEQVQDLEQLNTVRKHLDTVNPRLKLKVVGELG